MKKITVWFRCLICAFLVAQPAVPLASSIDETISEQTLRFDVAFSHWYSDSFRSAEQGKNLSIGVGYTTPLDWLEIVGRYEWAKIEVDDASPLHPMFDGNRVNFYTIGPAFKKDFTIGEQTLTVKFLLLNLLYVDIENHDGVYGESSGFEIEWLFDNKQGVIFNFREQGYDLPDAPPGHEKAQVDAMAILGYVRRF
ncbi:MAG: hypothetical protein KZQ95_01400 [Candidatus Thiodiazotropha sp. (ex Epidulcina cf. delphinae)]|nr:hypothetical protein [Candidatus Thiodiazotropha sp. (ex Epidulcina cf. delphinae)]